MIQSLLGRWKSALGPTSNKENTHPKPATIIVSRGSILLGMYWTQKAIGVYVSTKSSRNRFCCISVSPNSCSRSRIIGSKKVLANIDNIVLILANANLASERRLKILSFLVGTACPKSRLSLSRKSPSHSERSSGD
jgi:hypothetical protein